MPNLFGMSSADNLLCMLDKNTHFDVPFRQMNLHSTTGKP